jgi:hypothetical protein
MRRLVDWLILIRRCSIEPGQHLLAKLCLLGVGGDPLAFRVFLAMAAGGGDRLFGFLGLAPNTLKVF